MIELTEYRNNEVPVRAGCPARQGELRPAVHSKSSLAGRDWINDHERFDSVLAVFVGAGDR